MEDNEILVEYAYSFLRFIFNTVLVTVSCLEKNQKETHVSEFRFSFIRGKEKGTRVSEFRFSFFREKEK